MIPSVVAVSLGRRHAFSKAPQSRIHLLSGRGVEGDSHCGALVQHRYLARRDPTAPNRTQVHLLHRELLDDLRHLGFDLLPGEIGENITTINIDLLHLPTSTLLHIGSSAIVEITGLRTPCVQMNRFRPGLMKACFSADADGRATPRSGIMGIVLRGGVIDPEVPIRVELPPLPHLPLAPV